MYFFLSRIEVLVAQAATEPSLSLLLSNRIKGAKYLFFQPALTTQKCAGSKYF